MEHLVIDRFLQKDTALSGKKKAGLFFSVVAFFLMFPATGLFIRAGYLRLLQDYPPETAAALTALAVVCVAFFSFMVALILFDSEKMRPDRDSSDIQALIRSGLEFVEKELAEPVQEHPKSALFLASLAGFLAGKQIPGR